MHNEEEMSNKLTKSDLKKLLKPIVRECIQESLLEGGLLSGVIAEVVKGFSSAQLIVEDSKQFQAIEKQEQVQAQEEIHYVQKLMTTPKKSPHYSSLKVWTTTLAVLPYQ